MNNKSKVLLGVVLLQFLVTSTAFTVQAQDNFKDNKISQNIYNEDLSKLSAIERLYYQNKNQKQIILKQFGYDIFDRKAFLSSNSKVSKNYRFNIGDRVDVFLWGDSVDLIAITGNEFLKSSNDLAVDKEGNISIPGVGLVPVKGKTASAIEQQISEILHSKFNKINVKVTLADTGNFPVFITGNVKYKGTVYLNDNANIIDALSLAGGVLKTGSLREIVYINGKNKSKLTLDLYDILLNGNLKNIKFNEGDVIFVKPIGKVAALREGVKNPGIYEFKKNETLRHLINYAGGLLSSIDSNSIHVESFDSSTGQRQLREINYMQLWYIKPQDGVNIAFKNLYNLSENIITVEGNVKHPGVFQYKAGMKLSDILKNKNELLPKTFIDQAVIERVAGTGREKIFIPVSLQEFFDGNTDPALKSLDKISIYPSTTAKTIEVSGYITNPGLIPCPENLTLKKLLGYVNLGDSSNFQAVNYSDSNNISAKSIVVEIISKNLNPVVQNENQNSPVSDKNDKNVDKSDSSNQNGDIKEPASSLDNNANNVQQIASPENEEITKIVYLYDLVIQNDKKADLPIYPGDRIIFRKLLPNETVESVEIFGYVNTPGSFKYKEGMTLKDALLLAKGLNSKGYLKGIVLFRPSISADQKKNIENSLIRLQEDMSVKVATLQAINTNSSDIQTYLNSQKDLLSLVKQKAQQDYGRIMIDVNADNLSGLDENANIELKPGDEIYIPYKSNHIVVMGEVLNNIAIYYQPKKTAKDYINTVGGYTSQADKNGTYIIKSNGSAVKLSKLGKTGIEPGDTIVIPKKIKVPINFLEVTKDFATIIGNVLTTVYVMTKI